MSAWDRHPGDVETQPWREDEASLTSARTVPGRLWLFRWRIGRERPVAAKWLGSRGKSLPGLPIGRIMAPRDWTGWPIRRFGQTGSAVVDHGIERFYPADPGRGRGSDMSDPFLQAAIEEAKQGLAEGGIPIGSVLVIDGQLVGRGHNRRVQQDSAILHAEMDAIENAGRLTASDYRKAVLYSTLSPCDMCSGMALLYKV